MSHCGTGKWGNSGDKSLTKRVVPKQTPKLQFAHLCFNPLMRGSVWRFLLTCLLLVAMPLQGFAAATMLVCGANHENLYGSATRVAATPKQAQHLHGAHQTDHHEISAASAEKAGTGEVTQAQAASGVPSHNTAAKFKCNACGPCCLGAALTTEVVLDVAPLAQSADFPDLTSHHLSPALGGLDRPPQHILA